MGTPTVLDATAAFDRVKSLVGHWHGEAPAGGSAGVAYRTSAAGSALVETWNLGPERTFERRQ